MGLNDHSVGGLAVELPAGDFCLVDNGPVHFIVFRTGLFAPFTHIINRPHTCTCTCAYACRLIVNGTSIKNIYTVFALA